MSRRIHPADAGMHAVKRVRGVREQASRIGLQQAIAEERAAAARLENYQAQLAAATTFTGHTRADFVGWRHHLTRLGEAIEAGQQALEAAATITADAKAHWLHDKARVSAVEHLLANRAAERAAAAAKAEALMLDDIAAQLWQRRQRRQRHRGDHPGDPSQPLRPAPTTAGASRPRSAAPATTVAAADAGAVTSGGQR